MKTVEVVIRGTSPIMFNRVPMSVLIGILTGEKPAKSLKKGIDVQEIARDHLYMFGPEGDQYIGLPLKNLLACLVVGGTQIRLDAKKQLSTKTSSLLPGVLQLFGDDITNPMDEPHVKILRPDGNPPDKWAINRTDWVTNIQRAVNPHGGEMVPACRPLIGLWGFKVTVQCDDKFLLMDRYRELFDVAGTKFGLCEFRPQRKGFFGQFRVDQWKEVDAVS